RGSLRRSPLTAPLLLSFLFSFQCAAAHRDPPSFPTRRSSDLRQERRDQAYAQRAGGDTGPQHRRPLVAPDRPAGPEGRDPVRLRSEEHTSELQSLTNLVCRLLLEKKKHPYSRHSTRTSPHTTT